MRLRGECEHGCCHPHYFSSGLARDLKCSGGPVFDGEWGDWCETHGGPFAKPDDINCWWMVTLVMNDRERFDPCVKGRRIIAKETG